MKMDKHSRAPKDFDQKKYPRSKAAFGYYGAKQKIATRIIEALPPHNCWVEAFCGSAAITLFKEPAQIEIINDVNGEIVNVFRQLRNRPKALIKAIALTPYAREEFLDVREKPKRKVNQLERARRFLAMSMMTVNGTIGKVRCGFSFSQSYSREGKEARVNRWFNFPERLQRVADRLRNIRIENRDARELVRMFRNRPATVIYLDPPYFVKRDHGYTIDANDEKFHRELLELCCKCKCMVVISGYETKLYDELLTAKKGWKKTKIRTRTRDTTGKDYARTEIIWRNKHCMQAIKKDAVPIRLTRKEKAQNKVNPPRK